MLTAIVWQLFKAFHPQKDNVDSVGTLIFGKGFRSEPTRQL
jgi:hypothetical protein